MNGLKTEKREIYLNSNDTVGISGCRHVGKNCHLQQTASTVQKSAWKVSTS